MGELGLEHLLKERGTRVYEIRSQTQNQQPSIQTAEKSASLFDFIMMVNKLSLLALRDLNVRFVPDEDKNVVENPESHMDQPVITYKVIYRKPKGEYKPRVRQTIREKTADSNDERIGEVYGQKFECVVQFNIFASVYELAEQVMEKFEEMIFTYTGYFKKSGIGEVIFKEQLTDENYDIFRQTISIRNIRYYIEVEKLTAIFQEKIKEIETLGLLNEKEA